MALSYSMFPVKEFQSNMDFKNHLNSLDIRGNPDLNYKEQNSRYPTLLEIFDAIRAADLEIISESKKVAEDGTNQETRTVVYIINLKDEEVKNGCDFTIQYQEPLVENPEIKSLAGIKSDIRIMIKLFSGITKRCGSFFILSPYEAYYLDKNKSHDEMMIEFAPFL